jgi:hypothetical protein
MRRTGFVRPQPGISRKPSYLRNWQDLSARLRIKHNPNKRSAGAARSCAPKNRLSSYAFELLELDGEDLRGFAAVDRKKRLARLLGGCRLGIVLSEHTDDDGATIYRQARRLGLKGIVSKGLSVPYRSGRSRPRTGRAPLSMGLGSWMTIDTEKIPGVKPTRKMRCGRLW